MLTGHPTGSINRTAMTNKRNRPNRNPFTISTSRRALLFGMSAAAAMSALPGLGPKARAAQKARAATAGKRPNILFICSDQERSRFDLPAALPLPGHDRLQAAGTTFANYHVNTSPCGPSRSVIYTGQHTQHTGVYVNPNTPPRPELNPDMTTMGDMLRAAGYYTAYKGKWHLSNINAGRDLRAPAGGIYPNTSEVLEPFGFSDYQYDGEKVGLTWDGFMEDPVIAGDAAAWLYQRGEKGDPAEPWFLAVNFVNPHDVMFFDATGEQRETRKRRNWIAPVLGAPGDPIYRDSWEFDLPRSFYEDDLSTKPECQRAIAKSQAEFYGAMPRDDVEGWRTFQTYYFNCLRDVDRHLTTVLDALERAGFGDNTIIIYTSDHGERAGAHGLRQKAGTIYKEDYRVPMTIVHPDADGGRVSENLFCSLDLIPTILGFAGVDNGGALYPALKGIDLSGLVAGASGETERDRRGILLNYASRYYWNAQVDEASSSIDGAPQGMRLDLRRLHRGVFDGRYKFARYFAPAQHHTPKSWETLVTYNDLELYDTRQDPDELTNLAFRPDGHKELILALSAKVNALIEEEVGLDNGSEYPGPVEQYNTLQLPDG